MMRACSVLLLLDIACMLQSAPTAWTQPASTCWNGWMRPPWKREGLPTLTRTRSHKSVAWKKRKVPAALFDHPHLHGAPSPSACSTSAWLCRFLVPVLRPLLQWACERSLPCLRWPRCLLSILHPMCGSHYHVSCVEVSPGCCPAAWWFRILSYPIPCITYIYMHISNIYIYI